MFRAELVPLFVADREREIEAHLLRRDLRRVEPPARPHYRTQQPLQRAFGRAR
jgi:hypothetical protein